MGRRILEYLIQHPQRLEHHAEKRHAGAEILDLTISNPTCAGFDYPSEEILAALSDPRALIYDSQPRGLLSAREAVAEWYAAR